MAPAPAPKSSENFSAGRASPSPFRGCVPALFALASLSRPGPPKPTAPILSSGGVTWAVRIQSMTHNYSMETSSIARVKTCFEYKSCHGRCESAGRGSLWIFIFSHALRTDLLRLDKDHDISTSPTDHLHQFTQTGTSLSLTHELTVVTCIHVSISIKTQTKRRALSRGLIVHPRSRFRDSGPGVTRATILLSVTSASPVEH